MLRTALSTFEKSRTVEALIQVLLILLTSLHDSPTGSTRGYVLQSGNNVSTRDDVGSKTAN